MIDQKDRGIPREWRNLSLKELEFIFETLKNAEPDGMVVYAILKLGGIPKCKVDFNKVKNRGQLITAIGTFVNNRKN